MSKDSESTGKKMPEWLEELLANPTKDEEVSVDEMIKKLPGWDVALRWTPDKMLSRKGFAVYSLGEKAAFEDSDISVVTKIATTGEKILRMLLDEQPLGVAVVTASGVLSTLLGTIDGVIGNLAKGVETGEYKIDPTDETIRKTH